MRRPHLTTGSPGPPLLTAPQTKRRPGVPLQDETPEHVDNAGGGLPEPIVDDLISASTLLLNRWPFWVPFTRALASTTSVFGAMPVVFPPAREVTDVP
jgi:hypothetical protein